MTDNSPNSMRILVADNMNSKAADILRARGFHVDEVSGKSQADMVAMMHDYDALALRSTTKVTPELLAAAPRLQLVGRAGIGVDNIDMAAASARGVVVMNTPFGNSITTAEHAVAMMLSLARHIPLASHSTQSGKWEKNRFMGVELTAKTLGLVGCGNIGSIVAERAQGLRMKVIAYDPFLTPERAVDIGVEKVELDELLTRADFISLHTPLTEQTRSIISADALAKMKSGAYLINCARGGLVDEDALCAALHSGHLGGAALDVFQAEPPAADHALFSAPNFICTPHLGASTGEAQENVAVQIAEQIADYLLTGGISNALNMPSLSAEEAPRLRPYMLLAERLGSLVGQLAHDNLTQISVEAEGAAAALNLKPIVGAVLTGLMRRYSDAVNMVNAPYLARERGFDIREIRHDIEGDYHTLIRVSVETNQGKRSVSGTLFGNHAPRLVEIFGVKVEANLEHHMLYVVNQDAPGFIGRIGSILGDAQINIGTFHLGRRAAGDEAVILLSLDAPIDTAMIENICAMEGVKIAKSLYFE